MEFAWNTQKNKMNDVKGKEMEQDRKGRKSNPDIDDTRTNMNYDLVENLNKIENCNVDELCFQHLAGNETDDLTPAYRLFRVPIRTIFHSTPISMRYFSVYRK